MMLEPGNVEEHSLVSQHRNKRRLIVKSYCFTRVPGTLNLDCLAVYRAHPNNSVRLRICDFRPKWQLTAILRRIGGDDYNLIVSYVSLV
jgi:hypothetical protein